MTDKRTDAVDDFERKLAELKAREIPAAAVCYRNDSSVDGRDCPDQIDLRGVSGRTIRIGGHRYLPTANTGER